MQGKAIGNDTASAQRSLQGWCVARVGVAGAPFPLRTALEGLGARALALPTLALCAAPPADVKSALAAAGPVSAWIFVSPAAVRFAAQAGLDAAAVGRAPVFAIGPGTAAALMQRGINSLHPAARHDADGVLAMPELGDVNGTVAIINAPGGRTLLMEGLHARGVRATVITAYQRSRAIWTRLDRERFAAFLAARPRALLLATSGTAIGHLVELAADAAAQLADIPLVVGSERLAQHARALGFRNVRAAGGVDADALLTASIAAASDSAA